MMIKTIFGAVQLVRGGFVLEPDTGIGEIKKGTLTLINILVRIDMSITYDS